MNERQQIALLEECIARLESENKTRSRENEILLREVDRLTDDNRGLNEEMGQLRTRIAAAGEETARQEIEQQKMHLLATVAKLDSLSAEFARIKQEWTEANHRERIISKQLQETRAEYQQLQLRYSESETERQRLVYELEKSSDKINHEKLKNRDDQIKFTEEIGRYKADAERLTKEIAVVRKQLQLLEEEKATFGIENNRLTAQLELARSTKLDSEMQLDQTNESIKLNEHLLEQITSLKEQITTMLIEKDMERQNYKLELQARYDQLVASRQRIEYLEVQYSEVNEQFEDMKRSAQKVQSADHERQRELNSANLAEQMNVKSQQLVRAEEDRRQLENELTQVRANMAKAQGNNENLKGQYAKLKRRHDQLEEEYSGVTQQLTSTNNRYEALKEQFDQLQKSIKESQNWQQMEKLKKEIDMMRTEVSSLISINLVMSGEVSELRQEKKKLEECNHSEHPLHLSSSDITIYPLNRTAIDRVDNSPFRPPADPEQLVQELTVLKLQKERLAQRVFELNEMNQYLMKRGAQAENSMRNTYNSGSKNYQEYDSNSKSVQLAPEPRDGDDEQIQLPYRTSDCRNFFEFMAKSSNRPSNDRGKWSNLQSRINTLKRENEELKQSLGVRN